MQKQLYHFSTDRRRDRQTDSHGETSIPLQNFLGGGIMIQFIIFHRTLDINWLCEVQSNTLEFCQMSEFFVGHLDGLSTVFYGH